MSQMIAPTLNKRDEEDAKEQAAAKCAFTCNDSGAWSHGHFQGNYQMAQMKLSHIKADCELPKRSFYRITYGTRIVDVHSRLTRTLP